MSDYQLTRDAAGKVTTRYEKMLRDLTDECADNVRECKLRATYPANTTYTYYKHAKDGE